MPPPVVYDILRLFLGPAAATPRGIDRVDLGYARHLFETWPADCVGVLATPWGMRLYDRARVLRGLDRIEALWRERRGEGADAGLERVLARLAGADPASGLPARGGGMAPRFLSLLRATGFGFGRSARRAVPQGAVYLNIGQLGWAAGWTLRWLRHRPDIRPVFMLHDLIPLEHPDLVPRLGHWSYRQMFAGVVRHAAGLILTTEAAGATVLAELQARGRSAVPTLALHLPIAPAFLEADAPDPGLAAQRYFVMCGAIDLRKNHLMMLEVWRRLVAARGMAAPKLVVAGSAARGGQPILAALEASGPLRAQVIVATGLPSPALRRLMAQARGLLMPSLAEGFGLPIIEALVLGTPVLASDIPAHREVGGRLVQYIGARDEDGWHAAIARLAEPETPERVVGYKPMTAEVYFAEVARFLATF